VSQAFVNFLAQTNHKKCNFQTFQFHFVVLSKVQWTEEQENELRCLYMENQANPATDKGKPFLSVQKFMYF
jgi:hypothetical protein